MITLVIILLVGSLIGLGIYTFFLHQSRLEVISLNEERQRENEKIEESIKRNKEELSQTKDQLHELTDTITSLKTTESELREGAQRRVNQFYEERLAQIDNQLEEHNTIMAQHYAKQLSEVSLEVDEWKDKLQALKDKHEAYIQAQQRQAEMEEKQDYYRLTISNDDIEDIELLRDIQKRLIRKDSIDKVIYEIYYRPAYDNLMSHLGLSSSSKICGIYKITDIKTGKAYIGQSVDVRERFRQHIKSALSHGTPSNRLYQAMQRDGVNNFTFEVLEQVPRTQLNEREIYWIEFYKTKELGLNGTKGGA